MAVTLRDVARAAGVSTSAVSRTYTPGASVSAVTRARVLAAAERLGYLPNRLASSLTTGRTGLVGLVADDFANPFFLGAFDAFTRALQDQGLRPLLVNLSGEVDPAAPIRLLRAYQVEAAVLMSGTLPPEFGGAFRAAGIPTVQAFARPVVGSGLPVAGMDDRDAGRQAARALIARGYGDLCFLGGPEAVMPSQDRLAGFREGAAGRPVRVRFGSAFSHPAGFEGMAALLAEGPVGGVFAADDLLALGAIAALRAAGVAVPGAVGLIGVDDIPMAAWSDLSLSSIAQPVDQVVPAAIALARDPGPSPAPAIFPGRLIVRGSLRG